MIEALEKMLAKGQDNAMLRFGLGNAYLSDKQPQKAAEHLRVCLEHDPQYSAAWKLLGHAYRAMGELESARSTYQQGLAVAESKGDAQVVKELQVFLRKHFAQKQDKI